MGWVNSVFGELKVDIIKHLMLTDRKIIYFSLKGEVR